MSKYTYKIEKEIEVLGEYDVVVVGAGLGGICAALSSADLGMKTALIERNSTIGGQAAEINTWGLDGFVDINGKILVKGYPWEILQRTITKGNSDPLFEKIDMDTMQNEGKAAALNKMNLPEYVPYIETKSYINAFNDQFVDVNDYRLAAIEMLEEKGVEILLGLPVIDTIVNDNVVSGVVVQGEFDKFAICAKRVVDTSQNAIVCAHTGYKSPFSDIYLGTLPRVSGIDIEKLIDYIEITEDNWFVRPMKGKQAQPNELRTLVEKECPMAIHGFTLAIEKAIKDDEKFKNLFSQGENMRQNIFYEKDGFGAYWIFSKNFRNADSDKPFEMSNAIVTGRKQQMLTHEFFKKYVPGFENSMIIDTYANISKAYNMNLEPTNYTRYSITKEELVTGTSSCTDKIVKVLGHPISGCCSQGWWITLNSLIPKNLENIIISSKPACRKIHYIATCGLVGHAAGASAAMSIIENKNISETSPEKIREALKKQSVLCDV